VIESAHRYTKEYESLKKDAEALELQSPSFWEKGYFDRKALCYSKALNRWLWSFQFLQSEALGLKVLCLAVQVSALVTGYFILAEPIYFESSQ
jgi:small-conductance mechanosensitive channel